ncbi:hypothetical protein B0T10DRAFT_82325 [Thelonectria olida]|uniref:Uncharacterized protein n=1 Tax=Thelonectria olida TaxID=1576542 RepID=A0A9P9ANC3_9HYPO|nr:hypothetical protein B0T10DRAFT_82325 [Thelonectria olida]
MQSGMWIRRWLFLLFYSALSLCRRFRSLMRRWLAHRRRVSAVSSRLFGGRGTKRLGKQKEMRFQQLTSSVSIYQGVVFHDVSGRNQPEHGMMDDGLIRRNQTSILRPWHPHGWANNCMDKGCAHLLADYSGWSILKHDASRWPAARIPGLEAIPLDCTNRRSHEEDADGV